MLNNNDSNERFILMDSFNKPVFKITITDSTRGFSVWIIDSFEMEKNKLIIQDVIWIKARNIFDSIIGQINRQAIFRMLTLELNSKYCSVSFQVKVDLLEGIIKNE